MFKMKFKIVEVTGGVVVGCHYLPGKRSDVKRDVEMFKRNSKRYEIFEKME